MLFSLKSALHLGVMVHSHPQIIILNSFFQSCLHEIRGGPEEVLANKSSVLWKAIEQIHLEVTFK